MYWLAPYGRSELCNSYYLLTLTHSLSLSLSLSPPWPVISHLDTRLNTYFVQHISTHKFSSLSLSLSLSLSISYINLNLCELALVLLFLLWVAFFLLSLCVDVTIWTVCVCVCEYWMKWRKKTCNCLFVKSVTVNQSQVQLSSSCSLLFFPSLLSLWWAVSLSLSFSVKCLHWTGRQEVLWFAFFPSVLASAIDLGLELWVGASGKE